jgi:tetratricopeptide (TPR) repeat protein
MASSPWQRILGAVRSTSLATNSVLILLVIAVLFGIDTMLVKAVGGESKLEAADLFKQGKTLIARGDYATAIDRLENALMIERDNRAYATTLAEAQLAGGRLVDAEANLTELLQAGPTDGLASLILARVLEKEARYPEAISYFHRAIYGHWSDDPEGNRRRTRFELIDVLAERKSKEELLAQLLAVEDEAPGDLRTRKRIGRLFLAAGSPSRAGDVFRAVLRDSRDDPDALAGLGDAEFADGNYRSAQKDFSAALRLNPDDRTVRERLDFSNEVLMLDPGMRGLTSGERFHRSRTLLKDAIEETAPCLGPTVRPETRQLLEKAQKESDERVALARQDAASETDLDMAEQVWQARKGTCETPANEHNPVALVLSRLAQ